MKKISLGVLILLNLSGVAHASHQGTRDQKDEDVFGNDLRELFPEILGRRSEPPVLKQEEPRIPHQQTLRILISQPSLSEKMPTKTAVEEETRGEDFLAEDQKESTDIFGNSWDDLLGE